MDDPGSSELERENERLRAELEAFTGRTEKATSPVDPHYLSEILAFIPDGVFIYDRELRFVYVNKAATEFAGLPANELVGKKLVDVFPSFAETEFYRAFRDVIQSGKPAVARAPFAFPDGTSRWFEARAYPLPDGVLSIAADITERVEQESERERIHAQILKAQKLESLGVLAGGIAHDFNNLLMSVLGYASLALSDIPAESPASESIRQVEFAAQRAADLCKQMLAYSGHGHFVVQSVDLSRLVEDMGHLLMLAKSKNATLKYDLSTNMPRIQADANQLHQVLINLVSNASDAIGEGNGVIGVSTGVMDCDQDYLTDLYIDEHLAPGRYAYLEVSDNGCGMSKDIQARVFEPFYSTKFTGRGLGLPAVLGIVRGHRGTVKIYTESGRGTTIKVLLPVHAADQFVASADAGGPVWRGSGTILVVDDEESVRNVTRAALRRAGFDVLEARDGQEALDLLAKHGDAVRLVLLDVTMPRMGGEEAYRRIRQISKDIPVILSSGYNEQDATGHFNGKGLSGFIQKPYRPSDLIAKIRELLGEPDFG
ncbi:MAG: hypothetical protein AMXMBFR82_02130 [Candidatus Hydrogenedentota bacterium]